MKALIMVSLLLGAATAFAAYNTRQFGSSPRYSRSMYGLYGSSDLRATPTAKQTITGSASSLTGSSNY